MITTIIGASGALECTAATEPTRPTPEQIDELAMSYEAAKLNVAYEKEQLALIEERACLMVQAWGIVPPRAEKSRRLTGKRSELTITKADTLTIVDDRVDTLKEALEANGYGEYFSKLFALRTKYEVVEGAESALKSESLPKRLSEKVLNLWGRCITVRPKKPSLKIVLLGEAKPARKSKKGGQ